MAVIRWDGTPSPPLTSQGNVLTTELNTLTNGSFSAASPAYDNRTKRDEWAWIGFTAGGSITPTTGATISVFTSLSLDATNYDDPASSTNPATHQLVAVIALQASAHTVRAFSSAPFRLPPSLVKFVLRNQAGVSLSGSGNVLALYTSNEEVK